MFGAAALTPAPAFAQSAADIDALKAQLAALSAKIEQLEKAQTQTRKTVDETQATSDKTADVVAQEKSRLSFAGDLRYRYEGFDVQYVDRNRKRDRIRARLNANFRVNDTITGQCGHLHWRHRSAFAATRRSRTRIPARISISTWPTSPGRRMRSGRSLPASSVTLARVPARCSTTTT